MSRPILRKATSWTLKSHSTRSYVCQQCRAYATPTSPVPPAPPLLLKLRNDLKTAMRAKDTARLNVLRSILADVTNASKGPNAVKTDMQLLSILRKKSSAAKAAGEEFKSAGRQDLVDKEEGQAKILEEYAGGVELMREEEVREAVVKAVQDVMAKGGDKIPMGEVMKNLLGPGGSLDGKPVEKAQVSRVVKEVVGS
ncbi:GatB/YqeY domain-containing protein [Polychaeton citri CBS 116435]|uniref:Altered inheritance of mitochondria protein 41 n=1 Tax=Polychaeton citri CBS 116435 TaxID=1314669 RepID=A0A9P4Q6F9_9PEZI|nr:GatB/YqeY domain-containing protein [Polychaeton citri CBS 116435]